MPATELVPTRRPMPAGLPRPPLFEAAGPGGKAASPCPNRATCKSPICRGDRAGPGCPGSRKEM